MNKNKGHLTEICIVEFMIEKSPDFKKLENIVELKPMELMGWQIKPKVF